MYPIWELPHGFTDIFSGEGGHIFFSLRNILVTFFYLVKLNVRKIECFLIILINKPKCYSVQLENVSLFKTNSEICLKDFLV